MLEKKEKATLQLMSAELGELQTNCYIVANPVTKEAVVIDPGAEAEVIRDILTEKGFTLEAVMLTHGHVDHMGALEDLRAMYSEDLKVLAAAIEQEVLMVADYNLTGWNGKPYTTHGNVMFKGKKQEFEILGEKWYYILTPGHTKGSCCFYLPAYGWLFAGDTLFYGSVGRTDFPTGNAEDLMNSLNNVLMKLPDDIQVFPGHGPATTIGYERKTNPYVRR